MKDVSAPEKSFATFSATLTFLEDSVLRINIPTIDSHYNGKISRKKWAFCEISMTCSSII